MNIEKLSLNLRPRNRWEAVDLGFVMARKWFWQLWLMWLLVAVPVAALLMAAALYLLEWSAGWGFFLVWWCKPLYEQPLLYSLSRVLFGEKLSVRQVFRQYGRVISPQLLPMLSYRRLSFSRSFDNPVAMLEQLKGAERGRRLTLLHRRQGSVAMWLTVLYVHVEFILQMSVIALLALLLPPEQELLSWSDLLFSTGSWLDWLNLLTYLLAASVIAPFYVAAGFVMYINRRAELEGWDIELQFKRLRQRVMQRDSRRRAAAANAAGTAGGLSVVLLGALLGMMLWSVPQHSMATATQSAVEVAAAHGTALDKTSAREQIDAVLAEAAFGETRTENSWKRVADTTAAEGADDGEKSWWEAWLEKLFERWFGGEADDEEGSNGGSSKLMAGLLEVLLWSLLAAVLMFVLYHAGKWANAMGWIRLQSAVPPRQLPPTELFGLELKEQSLPQNVPAQALRLLEQGQWRACLALLYRASLVRLIHRHGVDIRSSFTEQECDRLVQAQRPGAQAAYFARLTRQWLLLAYGHQQPQEEQARQLCHDWDVHFAAEAATDTGTDADAAAAGAGA